MIAKFLFHEVDYWEGHLVFHTTYNHDNGNLHKLEKLNNF